MAQIEARLHLPIPPGEMRTAHLMALAEILTRANAEWVYNELMEGREVPCCLGCAEPSIKYVPPPLGHQQRCQNLWPISDIIARGKANCLDASAADAGIERGKALYEMNHGLEVKHDPEAWVNLEITSPLDYHAVAYVKGERVDSSAKLEQGDCGCVVPTRF